MVERMIREQKKRTQRGGGPLITLDEEKQQALKGRYWVSGPLSYDARYGQPEAQFTYDSFVPMPQDVRNLLNEAYTPSAAATGAISFVWSAWVASRRTVLVPSGKAWRAAMSLRSSPSHWRSTSTGT